MKTKKLTELSLLTAISLIIFIVELRFPNLSPVEGVKLGLANIITVYAVYKFTAKETFLMVLTRIILGALFATNAYTFLFSFAGAMFCLAGMLILKKIIPIDYLWLCSIIGAVLHNTGQIVMAVITMRSFAVLYNYPLLVISGCIAGLFTGITAQVILKRTKNNKIKTDV